MNLFTHEWMQMLHLWSALVIQSSPLSVCVFTGSWRSCESWNWERCMIFWTCSLISSIYHQRQASATVVGQNISSGEPLRRIILPDSSTTHVLDLCWNRARTFVYILTGKTCKILLNLIATIHILSCAWSVRRKWFSTIPLGSQIFCGAHAFLVYRHCPDKPGQSQMYLQVAVEIHFDVTRECLCVSRGLS